LADLPPNGRILHIAHSGGAILTYLAAKHHLTAQETGRIDVVTLGGGKSLTHKYFPGSRLHNYYARNDPLTILDVRANRMLKKCKANTSYEIIREPKHNSSFVFLPALAQNPLYDHSMLGPTYQYALRLEAQAYRDRLSQLLALSMKEKDRIRLFRKRAASWTGMHHFWDWYVYKNTGNAMRRLRKFSAKVTGRHGYFSGKYFEKKIEVVLNITNEITRKDCIYEEDEILYDLSR
jgi:hypothetical protein